jgi:pantetheine-phosphate adenylyltransferase
MRTALFPGSFDPATNGHLDVIERASKLFDKLIISIAINETKNPLFTIAERQDLLKLSCKEKGLTNIEFKSFDGLLVDAVKEFNACVVVRGLRALSDFEFEFQMALMNRELNHLCETVFLMPSPEYSFTSSRMIKEIAKYNGDISAFVPKVVMEALQKKKLLNK